MAREERTETREILELIIPYVIVEGYDFPNSITVLQGATSKKVTLFTVIDIH